MNYKIFRPLDVRALADEELDDETVRQVGRAFGTYMVLEGRPSVVVGRDNRLTSGRIAAALVGGILSAGCDVVDVADTTSPMLSFGISQLGVGGGAMVTGSHNPPEYNGIKLQAGVLPLHGERLQRLVQLIRDGSFARGGGRLTRGDLLPAYLQVLRERIPFIGPLKVVVDCGNGNSGMFAPGLFRALGCHTVPLYCEPDGRFPNHHPDPAVPDNLRDLCARVKAEGAHLGVAYDGDANRVGVVDETGRVVSPDIVLGLLAKDIIEQKGPSTVVCEVKTSQALVEYVEGRGGRVVMTRVGYPNVLETMFREGAEVAGELAGHFCFKESPFEYGDAVYVSCRVASILARARTPLSELLADFPRFHSTPEFRIRCGDERKHEVVTLAREHFGKRHDILQIDGLRILFEDGGWALIRASNTEPVLVVRLEARTGEGLRLIMETVMPYLRGLGIRIGDVPHAPAGDGG
jgi:phosphomannomutase/phosphoglucomutase